MWPECDNCDFYNVGDTCDHCAVHHRQRRKVYRDYEYDEDEPTDLNYDECGDGYFNE